MARLAICKWRSSVGLLTIVHGVSDFLNSVCALQGGGGAGKKQVAAMLGVQTLRASTRPRPFLRLSPQHLAVQARARSSSHTCCALMTLCSLVASQAIQQVS